jgi:hypothetical protein
MFGRNAGVAVDTLDDAKKDLAASLDRLWAWVQKDVKKRVG